MTFIVSPKGVKNTKGTTAKFGGGGSVRISSGFQNTGDVEIDIRANLDVAGDVINGGTFHIKDYVTEERYKLVEQAIDELKGKPRDYLQYFYTYLQDGEFEQAEGRFQKFFSYVKKHPELVTGSVQILLQLFLRTG